MGLEELLYERAFNEAKLNAKKEIAKELKKEGFDTLQIEKYTKLSVAEIEKL